VKGEIFKTIEEVGIIMALIAFVGFFIYVLIIIVAYPSEGFKFTIESIFPFITLIILFVDSFLFSFLISRREKNKGETTTGSEEKEEELLKKKEEKREKEKAKKVRKKQKAKRRTKQRREKEILESKKSSKKKIEIINIFSILFKVVGLIFFILSLLFLWANIQVIILNDLAILLIYFIYVLYIFAIAVSYIGIVKGEISKIVEKFGIITALIALFGFFAYCLVLIILAFSSGLTFQIGYYFAAISTIIISVDIFVFRGYYLRQKEEIALEAEETQLILKMRDRIETKADYPERWALIHGEKPLENENFLHFKEFEIEKPPSTYHPNYLHLIIKNSIEDLGYRIEKSQKPLVEKDYGFNYYDLYGLIKGSLRTSSFKKGMTEGRLIKFILGIGFLLSCIILLILNLILMPISIWQFIFALFVLVPLSLVFLISFTPKIKGYGNIYVLEQGMGYYGKEYEYKEESETTGKVLETPRIGFKLKISLAAAVKKMSAKKAELHLEKLLTIIKNQ
jgi:MFS family permease